MTLRQRLLRIFYPLLLSLQGRSAKKLSPVDQTTTPPVSFHSLSAALNSGAPLPFETLKGKKVLLVNTASDCGYTPQYAELQTLYEKAKGRLEIIAFPANDFKEQEKGNDQDIAAFCQRNYGVSFPLAKKSTVVAGEGQNPVFQWLTQKDKNGWNEQMPTWNFAKYLVDEEGRLTRYFDPAVSPLDEEVMKALNGQS